MVLHGGLDLRKRAKPQASHTTPFDAVARLRFRASIANRSVGADDVHSAAFTVEFNDAVDERKESKILPLAHIPARMKSVADLPHQDVASDHPLPAKPLYASLLRLGIAAIAARALALLVCHRIAPSRPILDRPMLSLLPGNHRRGRHAYGFA
jgi:hypothetical protein